MTTLLHPATAFIQSLPYTEVAFGDMTPLQQRAVWSYMDCDGDGDWAEHVGCLDAAKLMYSDVRFGVGKFPNDLAMKKAFLTGFPGEDEEWPSIEAWFKHRFTCDYVAEPQPPVILEHANLAPEFGVIQWGFEEFYSHWVHLDNTEFVCFLPEWDSNDPDGRGGQ